MIAAAESLDSETSGLVRRSDERFSRVYPNPGTGLFTLELYSQPSVCTIEVYNIMGERLHQFQAGPGALHEINLLHHTPGIYVIRVMMDGETGAVKVVKQN
jgi:hypothetical protein